MSDAIWIPTTTRLPADGQRVVVKTAHGTVEHRVTFRAGPEPQWYNQHFISDLDLYTYWRPLAPERPRPARDARVAAP
jgi:hypothetical protein